ncbi:tyrosine-type recombinase/integrase [Streptomyces variegatus]|uniref:tyrosine-type recombinase/integrase n=1 Tax=Streptomyces variegatus TaxID=284040 RepID=UPI003C2BC44A
MAAAAADDGPVAAAAPGLDAQAEPGVEACGSGQLPQILVDAVLTGQADVPAGLLVEQLAWADHATGRRGVVHGGLLVRAVRGKGPWKRALVAAGVIPPPPPRPQRKTEEGARRARPNTKHAAAPEDGFHALRHTFASVQLDAREPVVLVSKWLGHSDPSITLKIYAHMMPEADGRGRAAMDAWFEGGS